MTTDEKNIVVIHNKIEKPIFEKTIIPSIDSFNLAEFPLVPLNYQTQHLANSIHRFEWYQNDKSGEKKLFFFERTFGKTAPNADTDDYLLILLYLAQNSDDPLVIKSNFYQILKLRGKKYKPNQQYIKTVIRHLDALYGLSIHTNAVYSKEEKKWFQVKTRVIGGYEYEDEGIYRIRTIKKKTNEGEYIQIQSKENIRGLAKIYLQERFYESFVKENVSLDLKTYFNLHYPISKKIYRFGNKYLHMFSEHSLDLGLFCTSRIGMSPTYVQNYLSLNHISKLIDKLQPHIERVNQTKDMIVKIESSKSTPSGYKIIFTKPTIKLSVSTSKKGFTKSEKTAYNNLLKEGLYKGAAKNTIIHCRKVVGKEVAKYIEFSIKKFKQYESTNVLNYKDKRAGILYNAIKDGWYYPEYLEHSAEEQKREERKDFERCQIKLEVKEEKFDITQLLGKKIGKSHHSDYEQFKQDYPEVYEKIRKKTIRRYESSRKELENCQNIRFDKMVENAIRSFSEKCFKEFRQGNMDYFPEFLEGIK